MSELQAAAAERQIEKTALDRAWVLTRLQENVEQSMQVTPVLDSEGNPVGVYQHQPMAADKASRSCSGISRDLPPFSSKWSIHCTHAYATATA